MNRHTSDIQMLVVLVRNDAPRAAVLAVADRIAARRRDAPGDAVRAAADDLSRAMVACWGDCSTVDIELMRRSHSTFMRVLGNSVGRALE